MGLAAPRKRVKLSQDPNNTIWTRDTGGFGHKIMAAQGWQPGELLGAKDAAHAEFHTAANASHIRVFVKDDNLGLGAKRGSGLAEGECTGLDAFQSLLGRLNGKDEDALIKEQKSREDLKRAIYTERRWGSIRFVKGGYLIGDKIQELIEKEEDRVRILTHGTPGTGADAATESDASQSPQPQTLEVARLRVKEKKIKKRKRKEDTEVSISVASIKLENGLDNGAAVDGASTLKHGSSKTRRRRKHLDDALEESAASSSTPEGEALKSSKKKKKHKEKREATIGGQEDSETHTQVLEAPSRQSVSTTPISNSGTSTPLSMLGGRHAVRSRNIAQKRLAVLDTASLNQIFMIKQ